MAKKLFGLVFGIVMWVAGSATAQFTQSPADSGAADSLIMVYSVIPDVTTSQFKFRMDLYYFNDANKYIGAGVGFKWDNINMQMDSAKATPMMVTAFDGGRFFYEGNNINTTNLNRRFQFAGFQQTGPGFLPGANRQLWASYYFTLSNWSLTDSICLDTMVFSGGTAYEFLIETNNDVVAPYFDGHSCAFDTAYTPPSAIVLTQDSLHFSGIAGGSNPPGQTFQVQSDNANFPFTLTETSSWMVVNPLVGTTPKTINVSANITALPAGNYKDSILVSAPTSTNSPQYVVVTLSLVPPPPTISATPSTFIFNGIANGSNPASQTLTIKNTGGSTLNWTVANSQPWLDLAPTSGTDSGGVVVSIDNTGLVTGTYTDTIVITDPAASNNPVKRPVTLNLGSDLPSIVAPSNITIVVDNDSSTIGPRTFEITNGGIGTLTFTLSETSPRILSVTPSSGTAPQSITVDFKLIGGSFQNDYFDTLWITSPEATNSPYPVEFFLHYINNPAILAVSEDTIDLRVYECSQGQGNSLPTVLFSVTNIGLDNPQAFSLTYESDLFQTDITNGELPSLVEVAAKNPGLPVGVYYDTIIVTAPVALGSPKLVIVRYTMSAGTIQPQALLSGLDFTVPTQENEGPLLGSALVIENKYGGCMPWHIVETIPWLSFGSTSGDVAGATSMIIDATGFVFGQYPDSFKVVTPGAVHDTTVVKIKMVVWKFFGDVNYDKKITVADLVYLVQYLFNGGPVPKPERRVGDVNCDRFPTVQDLVYMVQYMYNNGPIPCGNPFK